MKRRLFLGTCHAPVDSNIQPCGMGAPLRTRRRSSASGGYHASMIASRLRRKKSDRRSINGYLPSLVPSRREKRSGAPAGPVSSPWTEKARRRVGIDTKCCLPSLRRQVRQAGTRGPPSKVATASRRMRIRWRTKKRGGWQLPPTSQLSAASVALYFFQLRAFLRTAAASILLEHAMNWSVTSSSIGGTSFSSPSSLNICM